MAAVTSLPGDSSHLTVQERVEMIESFAGLVDAEMIAQSHMRAWVDMPMLTDTDTRTVRRMGDSTLQNVNDQNSGMEMEATPRNTDRAQVTVDNMIFAREALPLINKFQSDIEFQARIAASQTKAMGKLFDAAMLSMGVKSALSTVTNGVADAQIKGNLGRDLGDAFKSGKRTELAADGADEDPDALYAAIESIIVNMEEEEVDIEQCGLFLRPTQYRVLLNNDKLINRDFSMDNGDFANGTLKTVLGVPIIKTTRLANTQVDYSLLNGAHDYTPTGIETSAVALVLHPETLLGAETIPLTSDVFYNNMRHSWYVDSYIMFAAATRRADQAGVVFAYDAANDP